MQRLGWLLAAALMIGAGFAAASALWGEWDALTGRPLAYVDARRVCLLRAWDETLQRETFDMPLAAFLTETTARLLGKKADLTAVALEQVPADSWFIAEKSVAEHRKATFFLEVRVTRGTNVKEEKAAYLREVFHGLEGLLGTLHPGSYVHVHETTGDAYGYGGLSQDARWHRANT